MPGPLKANQVVYVRCRVLEANGDGQCPDWLVLLGESVDREGKPGDASMILQVRDRSHVLTTGEIVDAFRGNGQ